MRKVKAILILASIALTLSLSLATNQVVAQTNNQPQGSESVVFEKEGSALLGLACQKEGWSIVCIVNTIITLTLSVVGGLAFLLLILGAYRVLTSAGNPEGLNEGRDIIIAAITGLVFVVFSVTILRIIGKDIFRIF